MTIELTEVECTLICALLAIEQFRYEEQAYTERCRRLKEKIHARSRQGGSVILDRHVGN